MSPYYLILSALLFGHIWWFLIVYTDRKIRERCERGVNNHDVEGGY